MGKHHLNDASLYISFWQVVKLCRQPLKNGKYRIFHARRVDEMIQALLLKFIFGAKLKIVFSSAAQRNRSATTLWMTRKMDAVIAMCQASASYLQNPPDAIICHGIQTDVYAPAVDKSKTWQTLDLSNTSAVKSTDTTKYGIAILGRVRKQKGVHLFVEACLDVLKKHPDFTAVIVGTITKDNEKFVKQLQDKIDQENMAEQIIFTGQQAFEDIPRIFSSLSLVAALSDNEGFGVTVLEAMSSGVAVLTTEAGAWPEVVRDDVDGFVVPVNDLTAIKDKLDFLLTDVQRLTELGNNGRERILQSYTVEREAQQLCDFFRTL